METPLILWLTLAAAGLVTFLTRLSFIALLEHICVPDWFRRALRFVPPAVMSAILLPGLANRNEVLDLSFGNPQLLAGIAAILVAWRTRSVLATIAAGMLVMLGLSWWMGIN